MKNEKLLYQNLSAVTLIVVVSFGYILSGQASESNAERPTAERPTPERLLDLQKTLAAIASDSPGNSRMGISVVDIQSGTEIFSQNGDETFNPASNAKVMTAACALKILGPEFRFVTGLYGRMEGSVVRGPLYIKGRADPTLSMENLYSMVREMVLFGIRRIEGGIVVDDTYFDEKNMPFAFDQQPNEDAAFRSPVGAASLNHNALSISIRPGPQPAAPAVAVLDPKGYAVLENSTVTTLEGAHNPKISSSPIENRTKIRVWGNVPLGSRPVTYFRRIDNPSLLLGNGLKTVLEESGITVGGTVQTGSLLQGVPLITEHSSAPLSVILYEAGKMSNNFVTETVLKTIGAERGKGQGTWEGAFEEASKVLAQWGVQPKTYVYRNGSGLFDADRFSPKQFTAVLRAAYLDSSIRPEFVSQLAVGGVDGTVEARYQDRATKGLIRVKTGTLDDVSTLSGYVFDQKGDHPAAFSILINNAEGYVSASRSFQEKIVTAVAKYLNP
jgi:D-alanyl-D-alanine carboxypeptidase/D-alanyl-D-alanine-endopeptidase (penicillin-binding protein 4)